MIYYKKGDLLKSDCTVIMHQANCFKTMGAGIARSIAQLHPEAGLAIQTLQTPIGIQKLLDKIAHQEEAQAR